VFDRLTQVPASPLAYLAVLGACALDAVLPVVPSETAGTVKLPWPRFAAADAAGAILWAVYAAGLGYLGGEAFQRRPLHALLFGLGAALLVALSVEAARRLRQRAIG